MGLSQAAVSFQRIDGQPSVVSLTAHRFHMDSLPAPPTEAVAVLLCHLEPTLATSSGCPLGFFPLCKEPWGFFPPRGCADAAVPRSPSLTSGAAPAVCSAADASAPSEAEDAGCFWSWQAPSPPQTPCPGRIHLFAALELLAAVGTTGGGTIPSCWCRPHPWHPVLFCGVAAPFGRMKACLGKKQ